MNVMYPATVYKRNEKGEIIAIIGSESQTAAKCQYCGKLVTATQIKYGDGRGIVYSIPENGEKPIVLDRAWHEYCIHTHNS